MYLEEHNVRGTLADHIFVTHKWDIRVMKNGQVEKIKTIF